MILQFKSFEGDTYQQVVLLLPKTGHTAAGFVAVKLENEAQCMQYIEPQARLSDSFI